MDWGRVFHYRDGKLFWKKVDGKPDFLNRRDVGRRAGGEKTVGYRGVRFRGEFVPEHRIVYEMPYGPIPEGLYVDHENGNKADNRLGNLRLATRSQNKANEKRRKDNKCGFKGVHQRENGKFRAVISFNGKTKSLGSYGTAEEAHLAYCRAAHICYREFARFE